MSETGEAKFIISGNNVQKGTILTAAKSNSDPDVDGTFSYSWKTSTDQSTWTEAGTNSTYTISESDEGKYLRLDISYTDGNGNNTSILGTYHSQLSSQTVNNKDLTSGINYSDNFDIDGSETNIDIGYDGQITLGTFFDNHINLKKDLLDLAGDYGTSNHNFDIWLFDEGTYAVKRIYNNESIHRSGAKTTIENSTTYSNQLADSNNYFIDAYDLIRSWSHTNLFINENNGNASFSILGTPSGGNTLSIKEISADPDGTGSLSYNWEISSDGNSWSSVSTSSEYSVTPSDEGKLIRVNLTYTDAEGFSESVNAKGFYQSFNFDNNTSFSTLGVKSLNPASGNPTDFDITFSTSGGTSTWLYSDAFARDAQTDFENYSFSSTSSYNSNSKTFYEGEIAVFQSNPYTIVQIVDSKSRNHGDSLDGVEIRYTFFENDNSGSGWTEAQRILYSDSGDAVFATSGTTEVGQALSITESTADPDGTGTLSYVWQSSSDETTWSQIGTDSKYTLTSSEEGKKVKAIISYTDAQGFSESVSTNSIEIPIADNGNAIFVITGGNTADETLNITESTADPDGTGTLSYVWQSSSDETTWSQIGTDSTYTLTSSEEGKKVRAILSYTDGQGFSESVTTSSIAINSKTYSLLTTINSPQEGYELTTTASTENITEGSTLYWSLSGTDISITDFASGSLTGSGTVGSDGTFSFKHSIANDGETEGYETINIKLFSDSERTTQVGETKSILIRDSAIEEKIAEIVEDLNGVKQVVSQLVKGQNYSLSNIRDYDGNLHANSADEDVSSSYKYQHALDVNGDGTLEAIYTNMKSGRWVTASINPLTGKVDYSDYGQDGTTRVVGIYDDPLIAEGAQNNGYLSDGVTPAPANFGVSDTERYVQYNGENIDRLALNSQVRFQNDLKIDNLIAKKSNDFDSDGIREVYWKTSDGTAYLRALMHADGNIRYANYQSESQMTDYLTNNGLSDSITEIIS